MEQTNDAKLKAVIRSTITEYAACSDREVATAVVSAEAALVGDWALEKIAVMCGQLRPKPEADDQLKLPFDLTKPVVIPVKEGYRELRYATIGLLRESEQILLKKHRQAKPRSSSLLGKLQREIELMEPWAYENRRITVERVHELITAGAPTPTPTRKQGPVSDSMKRWWEDKSPMERTMIARRRQAKRWAKERIKQ